MPTIKKASWAKAESATALPFPAGFIKAAASQFGACAGTGGCDQYYIERDSDAFVLTHSCRQPSAALIQKRKHVPGSRARNLRSFLSLVATTSLAPEMRLIIRRPSHAALAGTTMVTESQRVTAIVTTLTPYRALTHIPAQTRFVV